MTFNVNATSLYAGNICDFSFVTDSNVNVAVTRTRGTRPRFATLPKCGKDGNLQ